jgi:hypothetical protein
MRDSNAAGLESGAVFFELPFISPCGHLTASTRLLRYFPGRNRAVPFGNAMNNYSPKEIIKKGRLGNCGISNRSPIKG